MSDQPSDKTDDTGSRSGGTVATIVRGASNVLDNLSTQFLALVLVNTLYILGLLWFLNAQADRRDKNLEPIIASCLRQVPIEVVERLLDRDVPRRDDSSDSEAKPQRRQPERN